MKHLINGSTIARVPVDDVIYYHLELSGHDVILAKGAPAETYVDTGDRAKFEGGTTALFLGDARPGRSRIMREASSDMELVVTGPILTAIRRCLADRAGKLTEASPAEHAA